MKKIFFLFIVYCSLFLGNFLFAQADPAQPAIPAQPAKPAEPRVAPAIPAEPAIPAKPALSPEEKAELEKARNEIKTAAEKKRLNAKEREQAGVALERLVGKGIPVKHAKEVINVSIGQGLKGEEIDNVTNTILEYHEKVHPENLGKDVQELLKKGLRGKALAEEIHKKIEYRHQRKMAEQKRKREEKTEIKRERKEEYRKEREPQENREHEEHRGMGGEHPSGPGGGKRR